MTRTLHHEPNGYACNMGWAVRTVSGREIYRGPEWRARMIAAGHPLTLGEVREEAAKD